MAAETLKKFDSVVSTVKEDISGPKVLASILLYNKRTETLSAVSIGTGTHDLNLKKTERKFWETIKNVLEHKVSPMLCNQYRCTSFVGNRCITGNNLCVEGTVINDSHAEIIAKRGFRR